MGGSGAGRRMTQPQQQPPPSKVSGGGAGRSSSDVPRGASFSGALPSSGTRPSRHTSDSGIELPYTGSGALGLGMGPGDSAGPSLGPHHRSSDSGVYGSVAAGTVSLGIPMGATGASHIPAIDPLAMGLPTEISIHSINGTFRGTLWLHEYLAGASENVYGRLPPCVSQEGSPTRITPREAEIRAGKGSRKSWKLTLLTYHMGKEMSLQKFLTQMGLERPAGQLPAAALGPGGLGSVAEEGGTFGSGGSHQVRSNGRPWGLFHWARGRKPGSRLGTKLFVPAPLTAALLSRTFSLLSPSCSAIHLCSAPISLLLSASLLSPRASLPPFR